MGSLSYQISEKEAEIQELQRTSKSYLDQIAEEENDKQDLQEICRAKTSQYVHSQTFLAFSVALCLLPSPMSTYRT
jgi:cell division protein FtsB